MQISLTFLVPAYPASLGKQAVKNRCLTHISAK